MTEAPRPYYELVPDDADHWYYDDEYDLLLYNDPEYWWVRVDPNRAKEIHDELVAALEKYVQQG